MKLKPFQEIWEMVKSRADEALAPVRARQIKAKAELEVTGLEERMMTLEWEIQEALGQKDICLTAVFSKMDELDLAARKVRQCNQLVADLFPKA